MSFSNELKPPLDEALAHYGVKGMRWGVRRANKITDRAIQVHKNLRDGKSSNKVDTAITKLLTAPDRATWGRSGRFEAYHNKRISELERSKERIANGELVTRTLLFGPQYSRK